jgi:hypothetical protein
VWCSSIPHRFDVSIEPIRLIGLFRKFSVDLRSASFGAESRHALAHVDRRAFRAAVSSLLLLETLDLAEQSIAVEGIILFWNWRKLNDASLRWHTENVRHERLNQRGVALVSRSLHLGWKGRERQDIAGLESASKCKTRAVIDIDHHRRVWP